MHSVFFKLEEIAKHQEGYRNNIRIEEAFYSVEGKPLHIFPFYRNNNHSIILLSHHIQKTYIMVFSPWVYEPVI